jgi:regulator of protease activity HflC (stomatin/prohibitin superfamily)
MTTEKEMNPPSGYLTFVTFLVLLAISVYLFIAQLIIAGVIVTIINFILLLPGLLIINPNEARVLVLFGKYVGSVKKDGFFWVNPLTTKRRISLKARNLNGQQLKVNDLLGNPIEIAAVIVWQVKDTFKAAFAVEDYMQYINIQSEAAVRHLANTFPYDTGEDNLAEITLRDGADQVNKILEEELNNRLERAGIEVIEARISHLAYAPEIASANIVTLDDERKAAMVSNLLVVLCSERNVTPVVNTGSLSH